EVETSDDVLVDAVDEHVTVVGLDLGRVEDAHAVLILEGAEVAMQIELPVLGEDDAVERPLVALALQELQVRLHGCATVVRALRGGMHVQDHRRPTLRPPVERTQAEGMERTFGSVIPGAASSNPPSTAMPIRTASGAVSTRLVMSRGPSASCTIAR